MRGTYDTDDDAAAALLAAERAHAIAMNRRFLTANRESDRGQDELHEAWIEFGRHNWLWQLVHRKPSRRAT